MFEFHQVNNLKQYKIHRHDAQRDLFEIEHAQGVLSDRKLRVRVCARVDFLGKMRINKMRISTSQLDLAFRS